MQLELLPTMVLIKNLIEKKSELAPNPKTGLFSNEEQLHFFFVEFCTVGKTSNCAYGEVDFLAGYFSERLWIGSAKFVADCLSLLLRNRT